MPITAPSWTSQPSSSAPWPMVTPSPMIVGRSIAQWITAVSWIEQRAPISIRLRSPHSTAPNHTLDRSAILTSPIRTAVGAR